MDIWSVLGIGVAERVSASISLRISFICSLWPTPKRCSSSMISSPRFLKLTSLDKILWVPTTTSTSPFLSPSIVFFASFGVQNLDNILTSTPKSFILESKLVKICFARIVVGHKYTTCLLSWTALNAALNATSVFPKPTSPHISLSIILVLSISVLVSSIAVSWSVVGS